MTDRGDQIREIAYFLWLQAGCPEGQAERHWRNAEALLDSDPDAFENLRIKGGPTDGPADSAVNIPAFRGDRSERILFGGGGAPRGGGDADIDRTETSMRRP